MLFGNSFHRAGTDGGFTVGMVPFVAEFQEKRLQKWLDGEEEPFPESDRHGAQPKVPMPPTLEDLLVMKVNVPAAVVQKIKDMDPFGTLRKALLKSR